MLIASLIATLSTAEATDWAPPNLPACDSTSLLTRYEYAYVQQNICQLCGSTDEMYCSLDWPFSDVPSCEEYDKMRNSLYAYYGRAFQTDKWKAYFAGQSWYSVNPNYADSLLSPQAAKNAVLLKKMADEGTGCTK